MENSSQMRTTETPSQRRTKKVIYHDDGRATVIMYCPCGKYGEITTSASNVPYRKPYSYLLSMMSMERMIYRFKSEEQVKKFLDDEEARKLLEDYISRESSGLTENVINRRLKIRDYDMSTAQINSAQHDGHLCRWVKNATLSDQYSQTCSICLEDYESGDKIGMLYYCCHEFHAECIKEWLQRKNLCPYCNRLAIIPTYLPDWQGDNIRYHQLYFDTTPPP